MQCIWRDTLQFFFGETNGHTSCSEPCSIVVCRLAALIISIFFLVYAAKSPEQEGTPRSYLIVLVCPNQRGMYLTWPVKLCITHSFNYGSQRNSRAWLAPLREPGAKIFYNLRVENDILPTLGVEPRIFWLRAKRFTTKPCRRRETYPFDYVIQHCLVE